MENKIAELEAEKKNKMAEIKMLQQAKDAEMGGEIKELEDKAGEESKGLVKMSSVFVCVCLCYIYYIYVINMLCVYVYVIYTGLVKMSSACVCVCAYMYHMYICYIYVIHAHTGVAAQQGEPGLRSQSASQSAKVCRRPLEDARQQQEQGGKGIW